MLEDGLPGSLRSHNTVEHNSASIDEETGEETQFIGQEEIDTTGEPDAVAAEGLTSNDAGPSKRVEKAEAAHEPGKSLLPASRVLKIIKADEDMCLVQKEAQLLISLATEQFTKIFAQAMLATAERERRSTIAVRDIGIIGRSSDRFLFLQELLPDLMAARPAPPKKTGKATKKGDTAAEHSTMTLNHFVNSTTAAVAQGVSDSSS